MEQFKININVDVGEGLGNEGQILPFVSSCNIACGGHAGDVQTMQKVVILAKKYNVKIGAHPSFPDRKNFGRVAMDISNPDLSTSITEQINTLIKVVTSENAELHHIKPHGALYNIAMTDKSVAIAIILAIKSISLPLKLYAPYGSVMANEAIKQGIPVVYEAFADRNYNDDLTLVSRTNKNAVIVDSTEVLNHVYRIITDQKVRTINGVEVKIKADTFCIHGDNPQAVKLIKDLKENLGKSQMEIL